ncbi:MAG: hypothetical protein IJ279_06230 [Clostridia bacterium]|nr:hypothetical protein [Clostridia bacterium]
MTRKTRRIIALVIAGIIVIAAAVLITLAVREINRNPFLGTWISDDKSISLEFHEDGTGEVTYNNVKIPVLEVKYNGSADAVYAYDKRIKEISVTSTVYSKKITTHYTYEIDKTELILTNTATDDSMRYTLKYVPEL